MELFGYIIIGVMLIIFSWKTSVALCDSGFSELVPSLLLGITSIMIFLLTIFRAGNILFGIESYERLITLPFKSFNIILSRFIRLYAENLVIVLVVLIPGMLTYAINTAVSPISLVLIIVGIFLVPLIPITIAAVIGFIALAATARMHHRGIFSVIISILLVFLLFIVTFLFSGNSENLSDIAKMLGTVISSYYPPAAWFAGGVVYGSLSYLLFVGCSIIVASLLVLIFGRFFQEISAATQERATGKKFVMSAQQATNCSKSIFKMEWKRYFRNHVYVLNTLVGYILIVLAGLAILVFGLLLYEFIGELSAFFFVIPIGLGFLATIAPPSESAISIEGKHWWILKTMPIPFIKIIDAKVRVTLTIGLASTIFATILTCIGLPMSIPMMVLTILYPIAIILFTAYLGIFLNIKFPSLDWENATDAVKQGPNVIIMLVVSFVLSALAGILGYFVNDIVGLSVMTVLMFTGTVFVRMKLAKIDILTIE